MNERPFTLKSFSIGDFLTNISVILIYMRQSETDMTELIFAATERLMARDGLDNLSMHKIAKEAKISPGTIYLCFKNKDELLEQFARRIFTM